MVAVFDSGMFEIIEKLPRGFLLQCRCADIFELEVMSVSCNNVDIASEFASGWRYP